MICIHLTIWQKFAHVYKSQGLAAEQMSDFFSGLSSGIRFTDAQINQGGPLPGGPYSSYDGRINAGTDLLSNISPYAGPKGGQMGSDRNYQQIPHRSQQIIPLLYLPKADDPLNECVPISHAVDYGDIAFVLNSNRCENFISPGYLRRGPQQGKAPGRNAFCNLVTVNYILAGLQRVTSTDKKSEWRQLADDFDFKTTADLDANIHEVLRLISTRILPFGVCAGSEHQGGKHETGLAPVQAAVNHVTTMTVDGQTRDLVNVWRGCDLSAGDNLIFRLAKAPTRRFTLNHYYKGTVSQEFNSEIVCWQLVPDRFEMRDVPKSIPPHKISHYEQMQSVYDYRFNGYWRIGQTFQHRLKHDENVENYSNDLCFMRGQLLQITFAPMWIQMDDRKSRDDDQRSQRSILSSSSSSFNNTEGSVGTKRMVFSTGFANSFAEPMAKKASFTPLTSSMPKFTGTGASTFTSASLTTTANTIATPTRPTALSTASTVNDKVQMVTEPIAQSTQLSGASSTSSAQVQNSSTTAAPATQSTNTTVTSVKVRKSKAPPKN